MTRLSVFRRRHFQFSFLEWKVLNFDSHFTEVCSQWSNQQLSSIGWDKGLVPNRRQIIIWTNDFGVYWRIYVNSQPRWDFWSCCNNGKPVIKSLASHDIEFIIWRRTFYGETLDARYALAWIYIFYSEISHCIAALYNMVWYTSQQQNI